jgi:SAM-dependent methyltransferase
MDFIGAVLGLGRTLGSRLTRSRRFRARCNPLVVGLVRGKCGIEIGGPSGAFKGRFGILPVYPVVGRLDNCNFAGQTTWEGSLTEGVTFIYDKRKPAGRQYLAEATDLSPVPSEYFDFVLSSNALEHSANPLKALGELNRIVKSGGTLILLLPHREGTFDHRRPVTTLSHLIEDERANRGEDDLTHLDEIVALHDLGLDPAAGTREQFVARSMRNAENRCFHQHVFDTQLVVEMLNYAKMQLLDVETMAPSDIIAVATKLPPGRQPENESFRSGNAAWRRASVFAGDRRG